MTMLLTGRKALWALWIGGFIILGIRAYGYYTNDQSAFTLIADAFSHSGKLIAYPENATPYFGNFHPPLMLLILGCFIRIGGVFVGSMLLIVLSLIACLYLLLSVQKKVLEQAPSIMDKAALSMLFFIVPFTHESTLFLDIDNTVLVAWGALFISAHYHFDWRRLPNVVFPALVMGVVLFAGLWCKFTTPVIVYFAWFGWIIVTSDRHFQALWIGLLSGCIGIGLFLASYVPFANAQGLSPWYPMLLGLGRFHEHQTVNGSAVFFGSILRAIFYDMHWFSFLFIPLTIAQTIRELRYPPRSLKEVQKLFPLFMFWAVYLVYTVIMPTCLYYMPRYKYGLIAFFVWWMWRPFKEWFCGESRASLLLLGVAAVLLVFMAPDFPTSAARMRLWYHSYCWWRISADYYPASFVQHVSQWAILAKSSRGFLPLRAWCFAVHYISWLGIVIFAIHCVAVAAIYAATRKIMRSLWLVVTTLWLGLFVSNMSREYQLFYDAGNAGFPEAVGFLKKNLIPREKFIGYRDFVVYTGHQGYCLYDYDDGERKIDTARIETIVRREKLRFCAYFEGDIYKDNSGLAAYLSHNFNAVFVYKDYRIWKIKGP